MLSFKEALLGLGGKVDSTHMAAFGPDKSKEKTDELTHSFADVLKFGADKENANPNTGKPNPSSALKPSMSPRKPAATEVDSTHMAAFGPDKSTDEFVHSFADVLKFGAGKENTNPNTGKPSSDAFKPSMSPPKPAATEMEEKFQSPSRIAGQNPESNGFYPFFDMIGKKTYRGAHGFFSPKKGKHGIVGFSQATIDGPSAIELARLLLEDGWGINPDGKFQNPVNLVMFKDGSIVSFDHRRCWAAAQNSLRVPYIMHKANDTFINPKNNRQYTITDEETGQRRSKTWADAIRERFNDYRNTEGFEGSKELPALRRRRELTNSPCGRKRESVFKVR